MRIDYLTHDPEILAALQLMNDGTAYFNQKLSTLDDALLDGASLLPGWTRRYVIAHVAFNAQALGRLVAGAATGVQNKMYESDAARNAQIEEGASAPAGQLRELVRKSAAELDSSWRELPDTGWHSLVSMSTGPAFPATGTIWLRTREVWLHAVDLDSGASFDDFPPGMIDHLLANVLSSWRTRQTAEKIPNFVLSPTDRGAAKAVAACDDPDAVVLRGAAVDLARWATGRGFLGITVQSGGPVPVAPRWI